MRDLKTFQSTKTYDVLIAAPLIAFYVFSIPGLWPKLEAAWHLRPHWLGALQFAALLGNMLYFALIIALIFLRRMPVAKSQGLWPRALALLGGYMLIALLALHMVALSPFATAVSALLTGGSTAAEIAILCWLGRSFSILPEARELVTNGPYRYVRHPLYLAGFVGSLGAALLYQQPWALLIVLASLCVQLGRMHYEEQVLRQAFPEYANYAARSWRLVPGVY